MTGSSVFDYIHQQDHAELAEQLGLGLAHGPGANVPSPSGSEDGSSSSTTNNPDGNYLNKIFSVFLPSRLSLFSVFIALAPHESCACLCSGV